MNWYQACLLRADASALKNWRLATELCCNSCLRPYFWNRTVSKYQVLDKPLVRHQHHAYTTAFNIGRRNEDAARRKVNSNFPHHQHNHVLTKCLWVINLKYNSDSLGLHLWVKFSYDWAEQTWYVSCQIVCVKYLCVH